MNVPHAQQLALCPFCCTVVPQLAASPRSHPTKRPPHPQPLLKSQPLLLCLKVHALAQPTKKGFAKKGLHKAARTNATKTAASSIQGATNDTDDENNPTLKTPRLLRLRLCLHPLL